MFKKIINFFRELKQPINFEDKISVFDWLGLFLFIGSLLFIIDSGISLQLPNPYKVIDISTLNEQLSDFNIILTVIIAVGLFRLYMSLLLLEKNKDFQGKYIKAIMFSLKWKKIPIGIIYTIFARFIEYALRFLAIYLIVVFIPKNLSSDPSKFTSILLSGYLGFIYWDVWVALNKFILKWKFNWQENKDFVIFFVGDAFIVILIFILKHWIKLEKLFFAVIGGTILCLLLVIWTFYEFIIKRKEYSALIKNSLKTAISSG